MDASLWGVISGIVTLGLAIFGEYLSAQARKRKEKEAFDARELEFATLAQRAYEKMQLRTVQAGGHSQTVQDRLDQHVRPKAEQKN